MPRRSPRLAPALVAIRATIAKDDSRFVTAGSASAGADTHGAGALPDSSQHVLVERFPVNNRPETGKRTRRSISTAPGWVELRTPTLMAACPATRSFFVRAAPTDVNEFVVRARRSLRDQAIALGLDVGGPHPPVPPDSKP